MVQGSRMRLAVLIAMLTASCGSSTTVPQYSGIGESHHVETRDLPPRPDAEPIAKEDDWVKSLPAATCKLDRSGDTVKTEDGVLLSPEKAVRAARYKDGYNNLRLLYDVDREIFGAQRTVYEERIRQANSEIERLSPSWWDDHKTDLAWATGFFLGAATTIAIVYAVDEVQ